MNSIFEITSKVSTPLALGGVVVAVLFFIFRQIIKKNIFPKLTVALTGTIIQGIIHKMFILTLFAIVLGFGGYVVPKFAPAPKLPPDSITISLPSGMSFQEAVKMIAANDSHTTVFYNCTETLLGAKVEPGKFGGKTSKELIEALQYRLINSGTAGKYRVEHFKDRGIYEIRCD
jgi:hypothetical protein